MTLVETNRSANITSSPCVIQRAICSFRGLFYPKGQLHLKEEETTDEFYNFPAFCCLKIQAKQWQHSTLGVDRDYPTKTKILDSAWSWRNLLLVQRKAWNQELTEILIQEKIVTIFAVLRPEQHMAAQLTNIIFPLFSHFTCISLWNIKTSHKVPVNPLAPQHPLSGMCYFPESSRPAVRGVRPTGSVGGQKPSDPSLCPSERMTLSISKQNCLYVRKFIASWLH